ncbi:MAG: CatB-related O-acetyltransferase [Bacteroidales bacterium]|nr:CatB-related O-acetyltransferase [Bacteroidales bacterium]
MSLAQFLWINYLRIKHPSCRIRAASVSRNVKLSKGVTLEYGSHVQAFSIGRFTYINKYCLIDKYTLSIGSFCSIAYNAKIGLGSHPVDWVSTHPFAYNKKYGFVTENIEFEPEKAQRTVICNDVWIGANSIVLAGVKVGDGAIIGANSLVTKDVEPYSIVYGSPAEFRRYRFNEETRKQLLELKWWDKPDEWIRKNITKFNDPANLINAILSAQPQE